MERPFAVARNGIPERGLGFSMMCAPPHAFRPQPLPIQATPVVNAGVNLEADDHCRSMAKLRLSRCPPPPPGYPFFGGGEGGGGASKLLCVLWPLCVYLDLGPEELLYISCILTS